MGWRPLNDRPGLHMPVWVEVKVRGRGLGPHRRQPWGKWWDAFPKIYGRDGYITISPIRMVNWTAVLPQHNEIAPAYSEPIGLVTVDRTSSSYTSISEISSSIGGSSTFDSQDTFPFASIHPSKLPRH